MPYIPREALTKHALIAQAIMDCLTRAAQRADRRVNVGMILSNTLVHALLLWNVQHQQRHLGLLGGGDSLCPTACFTLQRNYAVGLTSLQISSSSVFSEISLNRGTRPQCG